MLENSILIILAAFVLAFIGLLWLRHSLTTELHEVRAREAVLQGDFEKRRDTVPYLLESARSIGEPTDAWRRLLEDRGAFHVDSTIQKELEFEKILLEYIQNTPLRSLNFLEAKKDIEDLSDLIEKQKQDRQVAIQTYNDRRKQFPYSLASAIFGFHGL